MSTFELMHLLEDRRSGSSVLAEKALHILRKTDTSSFPDKGKALADTLQGLCEEARHFPVLCHVLMHTAGFLKKKNKKRSLQEFLDEYEDHWEEEMMKQVRRLCDEHILTGGRTILLHSHSGSILRLFQYLKMNDTFPSVIQTWSGPEGEGADQADALGAMGFDVKLVADEMVKRAMKEIDLVILGADMITDHSFLNKRGSLGIANQCKKTGTPLILLADPRKRVDEGDVSLKIRGKDFPFEWVELEKVSRVYA